VNNKSSESQDPQDGVYIALLTNRGQG